jgi:hypothetical protein
MHGLSGQEWEKQACFSSFLVFADLSKQQKVNRYNITTYPRALQVPVEAEPQGPPLGAGKRMPLSSNVIMSPFPG